MAPKLEQLRRMTEDELVAAYDTAAPDTAFGIREYLDELWRRDVAAQTRTLVRLTWWIAAMTLANFAAVIVALFVE